MAWQMQVELEVLQGTVAAWRTVKVGWCRKVWKCSIADIVFAEFSMNPSISN